ncbi:alpha-N-acetylgalactosaminide alpha-2,6-sialyltransferase 1-like [Discoglossus pictus]
MESKMNCKQYFRAVQKILFLFFGLFFLWTLCDLWINQDSKALVNLEHSKTIKGRAPAESEGSVDRRNHSTPCGGLNPYDTELKEDYRTQNLPSDINCPDSLRYTASRVNWLKERFLDNITIFLKKDHFSEKEWRRLEKFVPPYGWKEVNYSVIKQVAAHLPEPIGQWIYTRVSGAGCITCAVVGNGGILNGSNIGQEIDSHDYIFRGNGAVIQGFEKDVGRRTSFYGFTKFTLWDCLTKLKEIGFTRIPGDQDTLYIELPEAAEDYGWLNHLLTNKSVGFGGTDSHNMQDIFKEKLEKLLVIHPDFMRYIRSR